MEFLMRKKSKGSSTFSRTGGEKKNRQSRIPYPAKISLRNEEKTKTNLNGVKLREFGARRPILKERLQKSMKKKENNVITKLGTSGRKEEYVEQKNYG